MLAPVAAPIVAVAGAELLAALTVKGGTNLRGACRWTLRNVIRPDFMETTIGRRSDGGRTKSSRKGSRRRDGLTISYRRQVASVCVPTPEQLEVGFWSLSRIRGAAGRLGGAKYRRLLDKRARVVFYDPKNVK